LLILQFLVTRFVKGNQSPPRNVVLMIMTHSVSSAVAVFSHLIGYFGICLRRSLLSYTYFMASAWRVSLVPDTEVSTNLVPWLPLNRQCGKQLRS